MRKIVIFLLFLILMGMPNVHAMEIEPPEVPESGEKYMPPDTESFGDGLRFVIRNALEDTMPEISSTATVCLSIFALMILVSLVDVFPGVNGNIIHLVSILLQGVILLKPSNTLIELGKSTVVEMTEYCKLLFPILTGALAAQGGATSSTALYVGASFFSSVLATLVTNLVMPLLYGYFALCISAAATGDALLQDLKKFIKWLISWGLKIVLYAFTAYIGITGIVSGTADASAIKFTKMTISGMVPVVGNIIADASETILVSAGIMKNAAGIYGIWALIAILIGPLLKIGTQYLMLKVTAYLCEIFSSKQESDFLKEFSGGLGIILAMTGTVCLLLLISIVCFMKGMS